MDRLVTDERLDRAIRGYLDERVDEIAFEGADASVVTERITARLSPRSARTLPGWRAVIVTGLAIAAVAGMVLYVGAQLLQTSPIPDPPAVCQDLWPGFKLLSSDAAGVSIQVPNGWHRSQTFGRDGNETATPDSRTILGEGTGNAGIGVRSARIAGPDLEAVALDALAADPDLAGWAAWPSYTRTDLMHGSHRAVRFESRTLAAGFLGGSILYIVERTAGRPLVVHLAWDGVPDLAYVEEAILRSLNPDGSGPAVLVSYPGGSYSWVSTTEKGCSVAW